MRFRDLCVPSLVRDESSVNKMTLNSWWMWCYPLTEIHTLGKVSWQKILELTIIRIQIFLMCSSPHLHNLHTYVKENSASVQSWISLNHLENVLSPVHVRLHRSTGKRNIFTHFAVNMWKYTYVPRRNPPFGKTPSLFSFNIVCIFIAESVYEMQVTIFAVWKHKKHFTALHIDGKNNGFNYEYLRWNLLRMAQFVYRLKDGPA